MNYVPFWGFSSPYTILNNAKTLGADEVQSHLKKFKRKTFDKILWISNRKTKISPLVEDTNLDAREICSLYKIIYDKNIVYYMTLYTK